MRINEKHLIFLSSFVSRKGKGVFINVRVKPASSRTEICGISGDELVVNLEKPAQNNLANVELVDFLYSELGITSKIVSGQTSKHKVLQVSD